MADRIIYLRDGRMNTGQLRDAGSELALQLTRVVTDLKIGLGLVNPSTHSLHSSAVARFTMSPLALDGRRKSHWDRAKEGFVRVLDDSRLFPKPKVMEMKLGEFAAQQGQLQSYIDMSGFLNLTEARLEFLLSEQGSQRLNTLARSGLIFAEDYVLRKAIYHGDIYTGEHKAQ